MRFKKIDKYFEQILNLLMVKFYMLLHLGFHVHPRNLKKVEFKSKLPAKFKKLVDYLDKFRKLNYT